MKYGRFRDPAGTVRRGVWNDGEEIRFGTEVYSVEKVETEVEGIGPLAHTIRIP